MTDEWKEAMKSFPEGIVIVSNSMENPILFCNTAIKGIISKCILKKDNNSLNINQSVSEDIKASLNEIVIKIGEPSTKANDSVIYLKDLLQNADDWKNENLFLGNSESLIQLRIHNITFRNQEAKLIAFVDCSAAQKIEQAESESKYKTLLISTVSHEIRTPIGAVLGTLDLLKPFTPKENHNLLEIARLSCEMIIFNINDLTVFCSLISINRIMAKCLKITFNWYLNLLT